MEILRRPREVPEEGQLHVDARVQIIPSGEHAGAQIVKLKAKVSENEQRNK